MSVDISRTPGVQTAKREGEKVARTPGFEWLSRAGFPWAHK